MYVISVIPLKRGITVDTLSYFSVESYVPGSVVSIPIRGNTVLGLVTESKEVSAAKTALRAATFSLRKLPPQSEHHVLSSASIKTAEDLSLKYAAPLGVVLYNLLPPEVRSGDLPLPHTHHMQSQGAPSIETLITKKDERYLVFRSLIRETFAHSGSVLLVAPTSSLAHDLAVELGQGISDRVVLLSSTESKSALRKAFALLEDFSKTKLIVATPSYALVERHDVTLTIIENARSSYYREMNRPYLDYRDVLLTHAKHTGRRTILADLMLRTEEEFLRREEIYHTIGEAPKRLEFSGKLEIVEMKKNESDPTEFRMLSDTVLDHIRDVRKKKGRIFLFAARRGLAPVVACMDCGYIFRSEKSGSPYSLERTVKDGEERRWFVCGSTGERIRASETCAACGSWRLRERGIGIQQIYDELHRVLPELKTILFDHMTARTYKKASFLAETFYATKGGVLLGTHMALPYLTKPVDTSIVVNMDALLATPTWRLDEENLSLLLTLRERTAGTVYVQTRGGKSEILQHAKNASLESFYTEEIELRKSFEYPPFSTFIHLTWQGTPDVAKKIELSLMETLASFNLSVYPSPTAPQGTLIMYGLIKVPKTEWPKKALVEALRTLHPSIRVMINPDKIV